MDHFLLDNFSSFTCSANEAAVTRVIILHAPTRQDFICKFTSNIDYSCKENYHIHRSTQFQI